MSDSPASEQKYILINVIKTRARIEQAARITLREVDRAFWRGIRVGVSSALFVLLVTVSAAIAVDLITVRVVW